MGRYVSIFGICYLLGTLLLAWLAFAFAFGNSGMNLVAAMASSFLAAASFVKDTGRAPTPEERSSYAWSALAVSLLISLVLFIAAVAIFFTPEEREAFQKVLGSGLAMAFGVTMLMVITGLYFLAIRWAFSWYADRAVR